MTPPSCIPAPINSVVHLSSTVALSFHHETDRANINNSVPLIEHLQLHIMALTVRQDNHRKVDCKRIRAKASSSHVVWCSCTHSYYTLFIVYLSTLAARYHAALPPTPRVLKLVPIDCLRMLYRVSVNAMAALVDSKPLLGGDSSIPLFLIIPAHLSVSSS